jgi:hypothetical protein
MGIDGLTSAFSFLFGHDWLFAGNGIESAFHDFVG